MLTISYSVGISSEIKAFFVAKTKGLNGAGIRETKFTVTAGFCSEKPRSLISEPQKILLLLGGEIHSVDLGSMFNFEASSIHCAGSEIQLLNSAGSSEFVHPDVQLSSGILKIDPKTESVHEFQVIMKATKSLQTSEPISFKVEVKTCKNENLEPI